MKIENTIYQKFQDAVEAALEGKLTVKHSCEKDRKGSSLNFHFKESEKNSNDTQNKQEERNLEKLKSGDQ